MTYVRQDLQLLLKNGLPPRRRRAGLLRLIEGWLERKKNATAAGVASARAPWIPDGTRARLASQRKG